MSAAALRLTAKARGLAGRGEDAATGLWPRAAAALARQALELALRELWRHRAHGVEDCSMRAQLLCLGEYLRDEELAAAARQAWGALSRACHHHPYELPPAAGELRHWIGEVERLAEAIGARSATSGAGGG